jgi:phosphoribosylformylglycinamidine synthase
LISGRETLEDIQFIGAVVDSLTQILGSAKGWAGAFYTTKSKTALDNFFKREDTLSVGICNGCQLFMELEVIKTRSTRKNATQRKSQTRKYLYLSNVQDNKSVMLSHWQEALWEFGFHTEKENSTYPWVKTNTICS